jgi:hypothetical protein
MPHAVVSLDSAVAAGHTHKLQFLPKLAAAEDETLVEEKVPKTSHSILVLTPENN